MIGATPAGGRSWLLVGDHNTDRQRQRAELGMAIGLRAEEVNQRSLVLVYTKDRSTWPSDAVLEFRSARTLFGTLLVARWLVTGIAADREEMDWITRSGATAVREGVPFVLTTRGYHHWRDVLIAVACDEASRLGTPGDVLDEAVQVIRRSSDASLVRIMDAYDSQLREINTLLSEVIDHAPQGIARIGPDMRITHVNPRMGTLLAGTPILVGATLTDYLPAEDVAAVFGNFEDPSKRPIDTFEIDSHVSRADRTQVWLHWTATAVRNAQGTVDFFLAMFEDITAKHEAEGLAIASLAGLERLNRIKSEFVSMVSHEFRSGLVGIQGFSELIRDGDVTVDESKSFAGDINQDAMRLNRMISQMLDLDRMESGRMVLQLSPLDINVAIQESVERAEVSSPKHSITTDLDQAMPVVRADSDRFSQVMLNLLSNAIKYSPDGGEVHVSTRFEDGVVNVRVRDQGPGIPPEHLDRLFSRYERFEETRQRNITGTGLGLAIARQIVELHGGRIWVDCPAGGGSEFHFTIPTSIGPATSAATSAGAR